MLIYKKIILGIALLFVSFNLINGQKSFEGKVQFKISHGEDVMLLNYFLKEHKMRMELVGEQKAVFIKTESKSIVLMPEQKLYMDLDNEIFKKMQELTNMGNNEEEEKEEYKDVDFEKFKTGKTKTILNYECAQWVFNDDDEGVVEAWVTDELGNFMLMESPMGEGYSPGWSSSLKNNGFFPLLVITKDEDGNATSRFEATEVNKQSLKDKLFIPPSDFSEMKIPGF